MMRCSALTAGWLPNPMTQPAHAAATAPKVFVQATVPKPVVPYARLHDLLRDVELLEDFLEHPGLEE